MSGKGLFGLILLAAVVIVGASSLYTVDEREKAIVFRFGEIIRSDDAPGLHWKYPFINNVRKFDARVQTMDFDPQTYLTLEQKNLVVDSFVKWRVDDVTRYYVTVSGDITAAQRRLSQR
jgi:modulator of FtsH protease HflC